MLRADMRRYIPVMVAGVVLAVGACGGENESTNGTGSSDGDGVLEVDNCTLLTDEEVSALAGKELTASEDSPLGCAYVEAGKVVGEFSIRSSRRDGDAAAAAAILAPTLEVIRMDGIGDDAVALADSDGSVNFIIARKGDLFVELVMTFLDVTSDSPALQQAGQLASTALDRLAEAA
jgi:hypothetical protein